VGAFHQSYVTTTVGEMGWAMYQFLTDGSQTAMQIVNDGTLAVYNGSSYAVPTGPSDFSTTGSFIVVEPTFDNPSGARRWQAKITKTGASQWSIEGSPNGGFSTGTSNFGSEPVTGDQLWFTDISPTLSDQLYISSDDSDTWDSGTKKYGWFRVIFRDQSAGTGNVAYTFYVGGYIPFDVANDVDPFVMLARQPKLWETFADEFSWGFSAGYAFIASNAVHSVAAFGRSATRNGTQVELQVFVHGITNWCLGYFGENTMIALGEDVTNWSANTAGTRISVNNLGMAWT
jgi:hypothetical protein